MLPRSEDYMVVAEDILDNLDQDQLVHLATQAGIFIDDVNPEAIRARVRAAAV